MARMKLCGENGGGICATFAVRLQLFDSTNGAPIWEHSYVNGSNNSGMAFELCETPVKSSILPRRLEDFSGDSGAELIRMELQTAVEDLTRDISSRICGSNQPSNSLANQFTLPTQPTAF
jgi:hypothetical protein